MRRRGKGRGRRGLGAAALGAAIALAAASAAAGDPPPGRFGLVVIDFDSFFCASCQEPLLALCRAVPPALQEERLCGVIVFAVPSGRAAERQTRIVRAKWDGFRAANGVRFAAVFDRERGFAAPASSVAVLLVSPGEGLVRRKTAPFRPEDLEEIVRFLAS